MRQQMMEILNQMNSDQDKAEKTSFDIINQHDRVTNLVNQLAMVLDNIICKVEMINCSFEDRITITDREKEEGLAVKSLLQRIEEQGGIIDEVSRLLQTVMEEQQAECEVIHEMEVLIARNREKLEELSCYQKE